MPNTRMGSPNQEEMALLAQFRQRLTDLQLKEEQSSDVDLLRWLRAREYNLDRAEDMLRKHLQWRGDNNIDEWENYEHPSHFQKQFPCELVGFDSENSPVMFFQCGRWDYKAVVNSGDSEEFMRFKDCINERLVREMKGKVTSEGIPVTQFISVVDMAQISFRQTSISVLQLLRDDVSRFEANYPERLKATYIINAPWFFSIAMNFVRPFLTKRTLDKFNIFDSDQTKWVPVLKGLVPLENLPVIYGGLNEQSLLNYSDVKT